MTWQNLCHDHIEEIRLLAQLAADESLDVYLVGGCLRDAFLNRRSADFDLVSEGDPTSLAKKFSRRLGGHWFYLDDQRNYSRVIIKNSIAAAAPMLQLDFAPLRASTLHADLLLRDFTMNAMAAKLSSPLVADDTLDIIDPLSATSDLSNNCLRMCGAHVISEDPLRIIKGLRHCAQLGLEVEKLTLQTFKQHMMLSTSVAGERIRSEFAKLFSAPQYQKALSLFLQCGGGGALGFTTLSDKGQISYEKLENCLDQYCGNMALKALLTQGIGDDFTPTSLARFIHFVRSDNGEIESIQSLLKRLHFNKRLHHIITIFCTAEFKRFNPFAPSNCSARGRLLSLQKMGAPLPESIVLYALLAENSPEPSTLLSLCDTCERQMHNNRVVPLITSKQILRHYPDFIGDMFGSFFTALCDQEIKGQVNNEEEAIEYLHKWYESN